MLRSMTGFGAGRAEVAGEDLSVEVRSLNHKFCEVKTRLPRELGALEAGLTKRVKDKLARGSVELLVRRQEATAQESGPKVNLSLAASYRRAFSEVAKALSIPDEVRLRDIALLEGVIRLEQRDVDLASATQAAESALDEALSKLVQMREVEGKALLADISGRIDTVARLAEEVRALAPRAVEDYRARLQERVAELSRNTPVEPQRLAQEVAFFAERTDVAEEMSRLASHFQQFRALLASKEPSGRKMDFLVQEMHREVNTTGSKSQNGEISSRVLNMKAELERVREQVQNVE